MESGRLHSFLYYDAQEGLRVRRSGGGWNRGWGQAAISTSLEAEILGEKELTCGVWTEEMEVSPIPTCRTPARGDWERERPGRKGAGVRMAGVERRRMEGSVKGREEL